MVTMVSRGEVEVVRGESKVVEEEDENYKEEAREGGIVTPETPVSMPVLE